MSAGSVVSAVDVVVTVATVGADVIVGVVVAVVVGGIWDVVAVATAFCSANQKNISDSCSLLVASL